MSVSVFCADSKGVKTEPQDLASNRGWADFGSWVDGLDVEPYERLVHLWEQGHTYDVAGLARQLTEALRDHPPAPPVRSVAENLADACAANPTAAGIFVADDS